MIVNVCGQVPSMIWEREVPVGLPFDFVHSELPTAADLHVVYGVRRPLQVPNDWKNIVFVASEPPEIRKYNEAVLSRYRAVLGPPYEYLSALPNFHPIAAVAPWWVGVKAGGESHYAEVDGAVTLSREDFERGLAPRRATVTTIVSQKSKTPLQQQRLRLVDFLSSHLEHFEVFGLAAQRVRDKADVLVTSRYHLAVENSSHRDYWTEKLADPILMDNVVFYGGHPSIAKHFSSDSVVSIDPWNPEETYRTISDALEKNTWEAVAESRAKNRSVLLENLSFHRELSRFLWGRDWTAPRTSITSVPEQHPQSSIKKLFDPLYKRAFGPRK